MKQPETVRELPEGWHHQRIDREDGSMVYRVAQPETEEKRWAAWRIGTFHDATTSHPSIEAAIESLEQECRFVEYPLGAAEHGEK